ncbi:MAG: dTDP-4-dehydrorhamnose reductase [Candidatus Moranbacteria bacterium]|nr:dTDP-4-dehydrorhamnose reductase [Candidatus Moranbacteria bacterium]NTW89964.1 dTDP-4-dehydrorhamnose reductase [Candidatus Moranbacteria bacterium]
MHKKILILGSKGMLGQELVRVFVDGGHEVTGWDFGDIDVTDRDVAREKIFALRPDVIINAVGYNAVDLCESDASESAKAWRINAEVPGELSKVAKELGAIFVHYSTDYVFDGGQQGDGYEEDAEPNPVSKYGESKLGGERSTAAVGGTYYVIRLAKLFGVPAISAGGKQSFFAKMEEIAREKGVVSAVDDENGCFTYAPDLASATLSLVLDSAPSGVYHLVNEGAATWYGALRSYFGIVGVEAEVNPVSGDVFPRPARRPKDSTLRNTKRPKLRSLQDALGAFAESRRS